MKESKTIPVHLVISVSHPRFVQTLVDGILALPQGLACPFTLHLPADAFPASWTVRGRGKSVPIHGDPVSDTQAQQLRDSLQKLMAQGLLGIMPAGFTGAPHSLLSRDEVRLEAEWAISNPWKTGFKDRLGLNSPCLLPFWADPGRESLNLELLGLFPSIGLGTARLGGYGESLVLQTGTGLEFIPIFRLDSLRKLKNVAGSLALGMTLSNRVRSLATSPAGKPGLIIHLHWIPQTGSLLPLFNFLKGAFKQGLTAQHGLGTLPVSVLKEGFGLPRDIATLQPWGPGLPVLGPETRQRLIRLSEVRQSRSSVAERVRSQLAQARPASIDHPDYRRELPANLAEICTDPDLVPPEYSAKLPKPAARGLISAMQGSATMMADHFSIRFHEGRIQAFSDGKREIHINPLMSRVMQVRGRQTDLESEGSIAFESDRIRGLRHNLLLNPEGARLGGKVSMDYVLSDRTQYLILDTFIRYPWMNDGTTVQGLLPMGLEMVIPPLSASMALRIEWLNADNETQGLDLTAPPGKSPISIPCTGNHWIFTWKDSGGNQTGLVVRRMHSESRHPSPMVIQVSMRSGNTILTLLPEGEWKLFDARDLRGLHHHVALGLLPLFDQGIQDLDPLAERDFDPFYLYRETQVSTGTS